MAERNINETSRVERQAERSIPAQTTTVARDVGELLRLRFEHAKIELSEFLDKWTNKFLRNAIAMTTAGLGATFMLVAAGLAIGDALGHVGWGMLIVGGALVLGGGAFAFTRPKIIDTGDQRATVDADVLEPMPPRGHPVTEGS